MCGLESVLHWTALNPSPLSASFAGTPLPSPPSPSHPPLPHHDDSFEMTPPILFATAPAPAAELISLPHIEIIDPPNKLRQEIKTKNNPATRHGDEFGATLTSCGDTVQLPSLAVPGSDSRKLIKLVVPDTIDGRALNERDAVTRCNVRVPPLPLRICSSPSQTLAPDAAKRIGCQAVSIGAQDLTEGWSVPFPPLLCFYRIPPLTLPPLSLSFSPIPFPGLLWQISKIQLPLSQIFVENHPKLVVLLQEAEDTTSLLRLLTQRLIRNALALGTEIFLEPQGIGSGDQKLNMWFDFESLESDGGTGISKKQDLARQSHGVVNWKK
jgi:hypothetical protein